MKTKFTIPFVMISLAGMLLCGCTAVTTGSSSFQAHTLGAKPSPYPSEQIYKAQPVELTVGSKPFAKLTPQTVRSIRITIGRDNQPPDWPDPCKVLDTDNLLAPVLDWLADLRIDDSSKANPDVKASAAAGSSALGLTLEMADGGSTAYSFNGAMMWAGYIYKFTVPGDLETVYESLPTPEWYAQADGSLLSADPEKAQFYVRRAKDGNIGELISHHGKKDTMLYSWVCLSPFLLGNSDGRVVFTGYSGDSAEQRKVVRYYSIDEQGDDLKELDIRGHVAGDPIWQGDALYYVGSSSDGEYPRPLNRANADFSRHIKVMDIPGPLVCLVGSKVYCLSQDRRSILRMPDATVKTYDTPIEKVARILAHDDFALIDADGKQNLWSPDMPTE